MVVLNGCWLKTTFWCSVESVVDDTNGVDKLVGANVQRFRIAKGMSQADLATSLAKLYGVQMHQQTIAKIEKGTRSLKYMEAIQIAEQLTVDVHDLSAGENEAVRTAATLERVEDIWRMGKELDDVADRLAYELVMLAVGRAIDRNKERPDNETEESAGWLQSQVVDRLETNWGRVLNERIHLAMQQHPYLAEVRPDFAAPTYAEVLKRVSESLILWPVLDESEA